MKRKFTSTMALIATGIGATILYEQIRNGNVKKMIKNMKDKEIKAIDDLENMM
ncbi:MAG: hypothetical protein Q4G04_04290 [bacterium]|nr:hypothetical protein [bacterium]